MPIGSPTEEEALAKLDDELVDSLGIRTILSEQRLSVIVRTRVEPAREVSEPYLTVRVSLWQDASPCLQSRPALSRALLL